MSLNALFTLAEHLGRDPEVARAIQKAQRHAPKGGENIAGKVYSGGQFIPDHGRVLGHLWPVNNDQQVPVVRISGPGMGNAALDLHEARKWASQNVAGAYENRATGWEIAVSGKGIKEAIAHLNWSKADTIRTLASIPDLVREAVPIQTAPDTEGRPDILHVHTFVVPIEVEGQIYRARMTVRETNMGHKYYGHRLENLDIEMPEAFSRGHTDEELGVQRHSGTVSVGQLLHGFKPHMEEKP